MLFFHHSLQYLSGSTLLQETQKVLGLLPSFLQLYIRLSFLLLTVNANGDLYHHKHVSYHRLGDLLWTFQLHSICSGLYFKQYYLYIFCSL